MAVVLQLTTSCASFPCPPLSAYMREIGTNVANWRSDRETVHFLGPKWVFSAFWHYKNKERVSRGLDAKWHIPSACLES